MNKFLNEINDQPRALTDTMLYYAGPEGDDKLESISKRWTGGNYSNVLLTGMGSSYFAAHYASCILSNHGIQSSAMNAGELLHYHLQLINRSTLLVCISQSGESYEVVKLLEKLPSGVTVIGITNETGSTVAVRADDVLFTMAGREEMTSTKTYITTLQVLFYFANALAKKWNIEFSAKTSPVIESVESLIHGHAEWLKEVMEFLGHPNYIQLIARGPSYASALQGALMFREGARMPAAATLGGEFRHGPMEMVGEGFRAIILGSAGATFKQSLTLAEDIVKFNGRVLFITNEKEVNKNPGIITINVRCDDEYLFPVPAIIPLQLIVNRWAENQGFVPGNFIRGAKVTTTE